MSIPADLRFDPKPLAHLPLIRAVVDQLQIPAVLDGLLPADPRSRVSDAECVTVMLLNILEGRVALYNMERWLERTDAEILLGRGCPTDAFNDARLAACLDNIADCGHEEVLSGVVQAYLRREDVPSTYTVHEDTTSLALYGAYAAPYQQDGPTPAYGYSKDRRPDLKQLVFGLALHGSAGIPLVATMFAGNTADAPANRLQLDALGDLLPEEDDVTIVGDCKLVDGQTLGQLLLQRFHFVSLLPKTYNLRRDLVEKVRLASEPMPELARAPGRAKADPQRVYRGLSFESPFAVGFESTGDNHPRKVTLRFVVVESTQLQDQEDEAIARRLAKERDKFGVGLAVASKRAYACAADAGAALEKLAARLRYHTPNVELVPEVVPVTRARNGRPRTGEVAPTTTVFRLVEREPPAEDAEAVADLRFHSRHFVLITDHLDRDTWPDERVLAEYRHQHILEGHTGFRWLKSVAEVAPMFLHTPRRIAALGVVFILALMVRNYIQFELRRRLAEANENVPDRLGRGTQKPTTETALIPFAAITLIHIVMGDQVIERRLTPLPDDVRTVLRMLRVNPSVFTVPPPRKMPSAVAEMRRM